MIHALLTKMCSEVLDKLDPILLLLPKLEMAILAGSSNEVSPKVHVHYVTTQKFNVAKGYDGIQCSNEISPKIRYDIYVQC